MLCIMLITDFYPILVGKCCPITSNYQENEFLPLDLIIYMVNIKFLSPIILLLSGFAFLIADQATDTNRTDTSTISIMRVEGTIGPTVTNYVNRSLSIAKSRNDEVLIMELDTPGGLLTSTQEIVQVMLGSNLPIVVYVSPDGANAGSAGTFITLAAHVAAMAPVSNIGAASPVTMGGAQADTVAQKKIFSFSESFIESIAEKRGRNAEWAKSAVRDGAAITATEALELNVIDLIAQDLDELLEMLHGFEVDGVELNTKDAELNFIDQNLAERFFSFIIRPEVMLILTLVAVYGILGEVTNPGAIVPGVSGAIALVLLLYGVAAMPINIAGFLLIGLAIALFIMEAFTPTYGALIAGGGVSFFLGALMLFQDLPENMQLSYYWLVPATLLTVLFFIWIVYYGIRAQYGKQKTGLESHIGTIAEVTDSITEKPGRVFFSGEYWNAVSDESINEGEFCEILEFKGLTVRVRPVNKKGE